MNKLFGTLGVVGFLLGAASLFLNLTKPGLKIGYAETSVVMAEFSEAIAARKEFEKEQKQWDKNLGQINDSLVASMNRMKQGYEGASKKEQGQMRQELERWNENYSRYKAAVQKKAREKEQELMEPVIQKVNSFLKLWGDQQGYDMILGTLQGGNILQANEVHNVTSDLLKDLNEHYRNLPVAEKKAAPVPKVKTVPVPNVDVKEKEKAPVGE